MDAKVRWYAGTDRSFPLDSLMLSAAQVRSSWGWTEIGAGQSREASWTFTAAAPFTAAVEYHYKESVDSKTKSANVEFTCGSEVPEGTPAPTITDLAIGTLPDVVEPQDSLTITYSAMSPVGLWQTGVLLSGPCQVQRLFSERLQPAVTRSATIAIPAECRLGIPIRVTALALDAGLQTGSRLLSTDVKLVDQTPPNLTALFFPPTGSGTTDLYGAFFGGDSILVFFDAWDNHELSSVHWEILPAGAGIDDSLTLTGHSAHGGMYAHLKPASSGPIQLRLYARDTVGLRSDAITTSAGRTVVYPSVERPTASTTAEGDLWDAIPDTRRGLVYLLQPNQWRIAVLSLSSMSVTRTIRLPSFPSEFDISAGGDTLVALLEAERALAVVDLRAPTWQAVLLPITNLDTTVNQRPAHFLILSNGKAFVTLAGTVDSAMVLVEVDLATGAQRVRTDAGDNGRVYGAALGRSLDHSVLVLNGGETFFQRYDVATDRFGARGTSKQPYWNPQVDATGQRIAIGLDVYDGSLQYLRRMSSLLSGSGFSIPTALSADGTMLYQLWGTKGLIRSRVSDGALMDRTLNPIEGYHMRISDDGTMLVTFDDFANASRKISTIDLR